MFMAAISEREPAGDDELALVASVAAGSTDALASLYDLYATSLLSLGMKILKDPEEANFRFTSTSVTNTWSSCRAL